MPDNRVKATCNDIGTEEIAHWEMIGTMIHQCLRDATLKDIEAAGLMGYYTMHSKGGGILHTCLLYTSDAADE